MPRRRWPIKALINARLIADGKIYENVTILFDNTIRAVNRDVNTAGCEVIDAKGAYVSAGFIDIHIHGSGGTDVMDATPEALETISKTLVQTGTTSFLATTMTMSQEHIDAAIDNVRASQKCVNGAQILGVHMEGPFINPIRQGAQDAKFVQTPRFSSIEKHMDLVKVITLAPEMEGAEAFIRKVRQQYPKVLLSIGHSDATYDEAKESFWCGVRHATHLFNAMPPLKHRAPGIVGAVFDDERVSCDVIADLVHLHPATLRMVWREKGNNLMLITDAMRAGCMKNGSYDLGGQQVEVADGEARLADGTLAGSVLKMNEAVRNMAVHTSMTLPQAIRSVTELPAQKLHLEKKGKLEAGFDADMVIFDEGLGIIATFVAGEMKYQRSL